MNIREESVREENIREFAYQIWEAEGRPTGQAYRHWEMACKLASGLNNKDSEEIGSGHVLSVINPDEPPHSEPTPDILPVEQIAPVEDPPHISPIPPANAIPPADAAEPEKSTTPIQPYASKRTTAATKLALAEDGVKPAPKKKNTKPSKTKSTSDQGSVNA